MMDVVLGRAVVALSCLVAGCSGDPGSREDGGGSVDASDVGGTGPIPWLADGRPDIAPPELTPCPTGWAEHTADGVTTCEPFPSGDLDCGPTQIQLPGEPECVDLGSSCPADGLPEELPSDRTVVYVLPGSLGGDGSRARPYGARSEFAIGPLPTGSIIALGRGTHDTINVPTGLTLWGACVAETVMSTSRTTPFVDGVVNVIGSDVEVRNLRIADSARFGISAIVNGHSVSVRDVLIERVTGSGMLVIRGASLTVHSVVVRDTAPLASGSNGGAIIAQEGGTAQCERVLFQRNRSVAAAASVEGASLQIHDATIRDTEFSLFDNNRGYAVAAQQGGSVELRRVAMIANTEVGMAALDSAHIDAEHVVVRDTRRNPNTGFYGRAMAATGASSVDVRRAWFERHQDFTIYAHGADTSVSLQDARVTHAAGRERDGNFGRGFHLEGGGAAGRLTRTVLEDHREAAIFSGFETSLDVSDVVIRRTIGRLSDGFGGRGIEVHSLATLSRIELEDNVDGGAVVSAADAPVVFEDMVIRGTMNPGTSASAGLAAVGASDVEATHVLVERGRGIGILGEGTGAEIALAGVVVRNTVAGCTACDPDFAAGVGVLRDAAASITDFVIDGSQLCGVLVGALGELDLQMGEVTNNVIGACVQSDGYDVNRLQEMVTYGGNDTNLQATTLPIPDPTTPIGSGPTDG